jgi:hypothetical protein
MTADHWIIIAVGIMNVMAVLAAAVLTPVVASRINQPKPKLVTPKPKSRMWRTLESPWFFPGIVILLNTYVLHLLMSRHYALTSTLVLLISILTAAIFTSLVMAFFLALGHIIERVIDSHRDLVGVVRDIAVEIENPPTPPLG